MNKGTPFTLEQKLAHYNMKLKHAIRLKNTLDIKKYKKLIDCKQRVLHSTTVDRSPYIAPSLDKPLRKELTDKEIITYVDKLKNGGGEYVNYLTDFDNQTNAILSEGFVDMAEVRSNPNWVEDVEPIQAETVRIFVDPKTKKVSYFDKRTGKKVSKPHEYKYKKYTPEWHNARKMNSRVMSEYFASQHGQTLASYVKQVAEEEKRSNEVLQADVQLRNQDFLDSVRLKEEKKSEVKKPRESSGLSFFDSMFNSTKKPVNQKKDVDLSIKPPSFDYEDFDYRRNAKNRDQFGRFIPSVSSFPKYSQRQIWEDKYQRYFN